MSSSRRTRGGWGSGHVDIEQAGEPITVFDRIGSALCKGQAFPVAVARKDVEAGRACRFQRLIDFPRVGLRIDDGQDASKKRSRIGPFGEPGNAAYHALERAAIAMITAKSIV